jgi:hypothetical protein
LETAIHICPERRSKRFILICIYDQKFTNTNRWLKNRRSQRIDLNIPVVVLRPSGEERQLYESTQTLVVSAHGALLALTDVVALN